ncbi:isoleucine--tRNA ligase [Clostridium sp. CAG:1193]|nr:isoleucine--tRNA ligase [Clostridium sp. CAG:1193]
MEEGSTKTINLNKNNIEITYDMLDVRISAKEGFNASHENNNFIILNITLSKELINEGIVREFISKVQQMRKTNDYEMMDRINIYYTNNDEFNNAIKDYIDFIKVETLADNLIIKDEIENKLDLNGIVVGIELEKRN